MLRKSIILKERMRSIAQNEKDEETLSLKEEEDEL